ncbi:hypothetical protein KIPB_007901 [Kipferlia bialata]|uniref:Uncharacterized protein n=1 Tax=Kipferlia bialata TaxID=797122 RepID=A0A9K3GKE1_9EUKA|nr:hypothetical protein KIPB_007901 [Kipferlia bialata]|eukprot:g7901.t1
MDPLRAAVADGTTTYSYITDLPDITAGKAAVLTAYVRDTYENEISTLPVVAKVTSSPAGYPGTTLTLAYSTATVTVSVGAFSVAESALAPIASVHNPDSALTLSATLADASGNAISSGYTPCNTVVVNIYDSSSTIIESPALSYDGGVSKCTCDTTVTAIGTYTVELSVGGTAYPGTVEAFVVGIGSPCGTLSEIFSSSDLSCQ